MTHNFADRVRTLNAPSYLQYVPEFRKIDDFVKDRVGSFIAAFALIQLILSFTHHGTNHGININCTKDVRKAALEKN